MAAATVVQHDRVNHRRLALLQVDGAVTCRVAGIAPWHKEDADSPSDALVNFIDPAAQSPITVGRDFYLNQADPKGVIAAFQHCAQSSGWAVTSNSADGFSAVKTFPEDWRVTLTIGIEKSTPFATQPIVQVVLEGDGR